MEKRIFLKGYIAKTDNSVYSPPSRKGNSPQKSMALSDDDKEDDPVSSYNLPLGSTHPKFTGAISSKNSNLGNTSTNGLEIEEETDLTGLHIPHMVNRSFFFFGMLVPLLCSLDF
jgi:hypothetical protein